MHRSTMADFSKNNDVDPTAANASWTFLTNHAHVLLCLAQDPTMRLRDVAELVGITERAVQRIVSDLEEAGVILKRKDGRRNQYEINDDQPMRHPVEMHETVGTLIKALGLRDGTS